MMARQRKTMLALLGVAVVVVGAMCLAVLPPAAALVPTGDLAVTLVVTSSTTVGAGGTVDFAGAVTNNGPR